MSMPKSNGGVLGSGIFGVFGTTIQCASTDTSMYCSIMKLFNLLIIFLVVGIIAYYGYLYFFSSYSKKSRR